MKKLQEKITSLSMTWTDDWFTSYLSGTKWRYIVWLTNNTTKASTRLEASQNLQETTREQVKSLSKKFKSITIGWWMDSETGTKYLDIGTAIDNLDEAIMTAIQYGQLAIWDSVEYKEIRTS